MPEFQNEENKNVTLHKDKQESLDKAAPKVANVLAEIKAAGGPEKYVNHDTVLRLVVLALSLESGKYGVLGKSPVFILERLAAAFNAATPHVILDAQLKKSFNQYKLDWLTVKKRV